MYLLGRRCLVSAAACPSLPYFPLPPKPPPSIGTGGGERKLFFPPAKYCRGALEQPLLVSGLEPGLSVSVWLIVNSKTL